MPEQLWFRTDPDGRVQKRSMDRITSFRMMKALQKVKSISFWMKRWMRLHKWRML